MPAFQDIFQCCGVQVIYGFEITLSTAENFLNQLDNTANKNLTIGGIKGLQASYCSTMVPGMYIIFLNEKQNFAFSSLLKKHGFKLSKETPFKNPKMKNKTKVFMYTRVNEYTWYEKFLDEGNKKIWKLNLEQ